MGFNWNLHGGDGEEQEEDKREGVTDARVAVVPATTAAAATTEAWADEEESEQYEPDDGNDYEWNCRKSNRLKQKNVIIIKKYDFESLLKAYSLQQVNVSNILVNANQITF